MSEPFIPNIKEAVAVAVAAIYFDDNSDYRGALYSVVKNLAPEIYKLLENMEEKRAYDIVRGSLELEGKPDKTDDTCKQCNHEKWEHFEGYAECRGGYGCSQDCTEFTQ